MIRKGGPPQIIPVIPDGTQQPSSYIVLQTTPNLLREDKALAFGNPRSRVDPLGNLQFDTIDVVASCCVGTIRELGGKG